MFRVKQILAALVLTILSTISYAPAVHAAQSNSTNYGVSEVNFGSGGELRACSTTYCSKQSAGELTVGNTASTNYQAQAGFNTNREILLEISVSGGPINLGILDATSTKYGSFSFSIRNYLSQGYVVKLDGSPPVNSAGHTLAAMSAATTSQPGVEQFGVNLRQNTIPPVGNDVAQIPDATFGFGTAATGYNTVNNFKYAVNDTIAHSLKSSGTTNYTMSVIENISTTTPGGAYGGRIMVNVVPTF